MNFTVQEFKILCYVNDWFDMANEQMFLNFVKTSPKVNLHTIACMISLCSSKAPVEKVEKGLQDYIASRLMCDYMC